VFVVAGCECGIDPERRLETPDLMELVGIGGTAAAYIDDMI